MNGIIMLIVGPVTAFGVGAVCDGGARRVRTMRRFRLLSAGFVVMVVSNSVAMLMPNPVIAFVFLTIGTVSIGVVTATGFISLLDITPSPIRGEVVAVYYMVINIAGLGLGPTTVGWLSTRVFGEGSLHLAASAVPILYGIVPLLLLSIIGRKYRLQKQHV